MSLSIGSQISRIHHAVVEKAKEQHWSRERTGEERASAISKIDELHRQRAANEISEEDFRAGIALVFAPYRLKPARKVRRRHSFSKEFKYSCLCIVILICAAAVTLLIDLSAQALQPLLISIGSSSGMAQMLSYIVPILLTCIIIFYLYSTYQRIKKRGLHSPFLGREIKDKLLLISEHSQTAIRACCGGSSSVCEELLLPQVIEIAKGDLATIKALVADSDYEKCSLNILFHLTSTEVMSGKHHFYAGQLNFTGQSLYSLCLYCLSRGKEIGIIDDALYIQQREALASAIRSIG